MKRTAILILTLFTLTISLESCMVKKDKKCKNSMKRLKKLRKSNPGMM